MTSRSYFGKMNSTLGSVVPSAMFPTLSARIHKVNQFCVVYKVTKAILKFDWVALFKVLVVSSKK